ncbi:cytochrome C, partial [Candidatus Sumerlaeota bacterium]|nr:cytochrome C [Candidatus Sumerlaeota bacterium]
LCGNHTDLTTLAGGFMPTNWQEDLLLPRQWDANGHAKGRMAPGGWIAQTDPDGKDWFMYSVGYRNMYDAAFNRFGDFFTYDSDMEWDMGMPWYVPTRICNATSGSDFGWRSGSGRPPAYFEDSLPPVVDIGPGSPTGVVAGLGAKFPARYQDALFALDWTFGTIWAIHLKPLGSSYSGTKEEFVSGAPLPVTDAVIGADGALYFTVGGRGTQSALYRVIYTGRESIAAPTSDDPKAKEARETRRSLEAFHGRRDPKAVETAWPHLGDADRFMRYAARIAIENQPAEEWQDRAFAEKDPLAAADALIAIAHQGKPELKSRALEAISRFDLAKLKGQTLLAMLRAYELLFARLGQPDEKQAARAIAQLDPLLPKAGDPPGSGNSDEANAETASLLVYLKAPSAVEKCLALMSDPRPQTLPDWAEVIKRNPGYGNPIRAMLNNPPPTRGIHYAFILRNLRYGWSLPQRETYFKFIVEASKHPGGASYAGFLKNTRAEALANCSDSERAALASITGESLEAPPAFEVKPVQGPGRQWTVDEAAKVVEPALKGRNFEAGRNAFYAIGCNKCHRFDGAGGAIGPDLTTARNKFSVRDLLEAIIEPSKIISDQFGSFNVSLKDGRYISGLVIPVTPGDPNSDVDIYTSNTDEPPTRAKKSEIEKIEVSKVSQMGEELVNPLSAEELSDLVAYLLSMGDASDGAFKK